MGLYTTMDKAYGVEKRHKCQKILNFVLFEHIYEKYIEV